jgi:GNAT superfamily N-acetyltransferase
MPSAGAEALRAAYDAQLRARVPVPAPAGTTYEPDGPVVRSYGPGTPRGFIDHRDLGGLRGNELDAFIARQRDFFAARGEPVEWKTRGHDEPADLPDRLRAAEFVPEERETVLIGVAADVDEDPVLPPDATLRQISSTADLDRIAALETRVWSQDMTGVVGWLSAILATEPDGLDIFAVEVAGEVVCAAWIRYVAGTDFAMLWGGSTLPDQRGRGLYRATVEHRARHAVERGFRYLEVDASDDSRPILQRLGFTAVTTTTPYVWTPPPRR